MLVNIPRQDFLDAISCGVKRSVKVGGNNQPVVVKSQQSVVTSAIVSRLQSYVQEAGLSVGIEGLSEAEDTSEHTSSDFSVSGHFGVAEDGVLGDSEEDYDSGESDADEDSGGSFDKYFTEDSDNEADEDDESADDEDVRSDDESEADEDDEPADDEDVRSDDESEAEAVGSNMSSWAVATSGAPDSDIDSTESDDLGSYLVVDSDDDVDEYGLEKIVPVEVSEVATVETLLAEFYGMLPKEVPRGVALPSSRHVVENFGVSESAAGKASSFAGQTKIFTVVGGHKTTVDDDDDSGDDSDDDSDAVFNKALADDDSDDDSDAVFNKALADDDDSEDDEDDSEEAEQVSPALVRVGKTTHVAVERGVQKSDVTEQPAVRVRKFNVALVEEPDEQVPIITAPVVKKSVGIAASGVVFHPGMGIVDFLRKNPNHTSIADVKAHFSAKEIDQALFKGDIFSRRGKYVI